MDLINSQFTQINQILTTQVRLGVEIEKQRVDQDNHLSMRKFPTNLSRSVSQFVQREFCEAQMEFAFPPYHDPEQNIALIETVLARTNEQLEYSEQLWSYSMPPFLPEDLTKVPISTIPKETQEYRDKSRAKYDVRRLLNTGVHVNVSFDERTAKILAAKLEFATTDDLYLQVAQYFMLHRWLLTYLFGATPWALPGYFDGSEPDRPVRSLRSSSYGFMNDVRGDYRSIWHYVTTINHAVASNWLLEPREYYESVRLKSGGSKDPNRILQKGVTHLELRTFDLNPLTFTAVSVEQLRFLKMLTVYYAYAPKMTSFEVSEGLRLAAIKNEMVALENPLQPTIYAEEGLMLLTDLLNFAVENEFSAVDLQTIEQFIYRLEHPEQTLAAQVAMNFAEAER